MKLFYCFLFAVLLSACSSTGELRTSYSDATVPKTPDYSDAASWCALPDQNDQADHIPSSCNCTLTDNQKDAGVDVFFIHPTSYFGKDNWNASIDDEEVIKATDLRSIFHQASAFNGSCRIYAPRYRQVTYRAYFHLDDTADAQKAFYLAYSDVKAAFQYYLDHYNNGRPIIIASHSQGSTHAKWLLRDFFDGKPLQNQLVAAYLIGMPVYKNDFQNIPVCNDSTQTGCYVSWRSFIYGYNPEEQFLEQDASQVVVVNPLTWTTKTGFADKSENIGGLNRDGEHIIPHVSGCEIHGDILWVTKPDVPGKIFLHLKNYHVADYNLYWMNIRENAACRIRAYNHVHAKY